jgi:hypothetical protein
MSSARKPKGRTLVWKWFGHAAHFICGDKCRFHMATHVGRYLVSTIGELWPERRVREINAEVHDPKWLGENIHLKGDYFDFAYMKRFGFEKVGCDRKYETFVFKAGKPCRVKDCMCGLPSIDGNELDSLLANDAGTATKNHRKMCAKWAGQQA